MTETFQGYVMAMRDCVRGMKKEGVEQSAAIDKMMSYFANGKPLGWNDLRYRSDVAEMVRKIYEGA